VLESVRQFSVELHCEFATTWNIRSLRQYFRECGFRVFVDYPWNDPTRPEIWGYRPC
jgi:hypothetical protein